MSAGMRSIASLPHDLRIFQEANEMGTLTWDQRLELIKRVFPSVDMDWQKEFERDIELAGRILRDVLKADQAPIGRPGPRPTLDASRAEPTYDRWMGKDPTSRPYSILPFHEAFLLLAGSRSYSEIAHKTGIPRSQVYRLLQGDKIPSGKMMEAVATAYGKRPSYFVEYRIGAVAAAIMQKLVGRPDKSISAYEAIMHDDPSQA